MPDGFLPRGFEFSRKPENLSHRPVAVSELNKAKASRTSGFSPINESSRDLQKGTISAHILRGCIHWAIGTVEQVEYLGIFPTTAAAKNAHPLFCQRFIDKIR